MKIALIGATGFVGSHVLTELVSRGHAVTAISRNPEKLVSDNKLVTSKKGDVFNEEEFAKLVEGHDAVISAYNPGWTNPDIYNEFLAGAQAIQSAVKKSGVKRILIVGGAGSLEIAPGVQLVDTPEFPEHIKPGATSARDYFNILKRDTDLDWTFLSPAIEMHQGTSGVRRGSYRTGLNNPVFDESGRSVLSVEDLAIAIADEIESPQFIQKRFTAAY